MNLEPSEKKSGGPLGIFGLAAGLLAGLALMAGLLVYLEPQPLFIADEDEGTGTPEALLDAVEAGKVGEWQDRILARGSRLAGQSAALWTAGQIEEGFECAGLDTFVIDAPAVVPVTETARLTVLGDEGGGETESSVRLEPFAPNYIQPGNTPAGGLEGELVVLTPEVLRNRSDFSGVIGIIDARPGNYDSRMAFDWKRYARLGVEALLVAHPEGWEAVDWAKVADRYAGMVSSVPVNFVRLAASPEIFEHAGERVRLEVNAFWREADAPTVVGIARAGASSVAGGPREAVVVSAHYDATGFLPGQAPGGAEAMEAGYLIQLAEGLGGLRERLRRDVVLVAASGQYVGGVGMDEVVRLMRSRPTNAALVGTVPTGDIDETDIESAPYRMAPVLAQLRANADKLRVVETLRPVVEATDFLGSAEATANALREMDAATRAFLEEQLAFVMKTEVFELSRGMQAARLKVERQEVMDPEAAVFKQYMAKREIYDAMNSAASLSPRALAEREPDIVADYEIPALLRERVSELLAFHRKEADRLERKLELARVFQEYSRVLGVGLIFAPGEEGGEEQLLLASSRQTDFAVRDKVNLLEGAVARSGDGALSVERPRRNSWGQLGGYMGETFHATPRFWKTKGHEDIALVNLGRPGSIRARPLPYVPDMLLREDSLEATFRATADFVFTLGRGEGGVTTSPLFTWLHYNFGGRVMASGVGQAILPDYPLAGALVAGRPRDRSAAFSMPGHFTSPFILTDPYGEFRRHDVAADYPNWWGFYSRGMGHDFIAARFDDQGFIDQIKDSGQNTQRLFDSVGLRTPKALENMTLVTFPARPVSLLDLNNPQTMSDYRGARFVTAEGLTDFDQRLSFSGLGIEQMFLPQDRRFHVLLQAGAPDNENVRQTRAFLLNVENTPEDQLNREIAGRGYLVADHPILDRIPFRASESMLHVNGMRLDLQNHFNMADERLNLYHERAEELIAEAMPADAPLVDRDDLARESVVYSTLNHPVLRESIQEAVWGILWYLFLMVPFIFFLEKLLFCFSDARKQVVAQVVIFLVFFAVLRLLHPAFEMVRSSLMILLGFIIIMITLGITFLFSSKFKENLEELRKKAGKVTAAEVNKFGVMGSAFMLGLNNMHRRKVRTGLTCATLVLLTFVMISFTSVSNDLVDERMALGKAHYQGMLIRKDSFQPLSRDEAFAFQSKYGADYEVARRAMLTGTMIENEPVTPDLRMTREVVGAGAGGASTREFTLRGYLKFDPVEPLREQMTFWPGSRWFTEEDVNDETIPVFISDEAAAEFSVTEEDLTDGGVPVRINGQTHHVIGVFEAESLLGLRDLNGTDLLPYDFERVSSAVTDNQGTHAVRLVDESEPRVDPADLILLPYRNTDLLPQGSEEIIASVAVAMPGAPYGEASRVIDAFLTQLGEPVFYGLDGVAYRGLVARKATMAGLVDLIIPLLIAGLTVLNTMRGSVYERRDEIYVYNAVGIAPRYVFFMFIAEAFVYAVVGSVLGYVLSQGVGRVLTEIGLTGGMNMTYTSMATIYASWTLMAAVFISTFFPARQAMKIAAPSDESGWSLPEPKGDRLSFDLPFNFLHRDRFAIIAFFTRYLREHGEGGAGRFFAGEPLPLLEPAADDPGHLIPGLSSGIWLKPYDLGVSQQLRIVLPLDDETGLYKARIEIERLSGTREAWLRLNQGFVREVRRQFLHWRAVSESDREEMFEETRRLLIDHLTPSESSGALPV